MSMSYKLNSWDTFFLQEWYEGHCLGTFLLPASKILVLVITKTCLYNFDPLKPDFYIVKLRFTGYTLDFLFLLKNIDYGYSLEPPRRGGSNEYQQSMF